MTLKRTALACAALILAATTARAADKVTDAERDFLRAAMRDTITEIKLGNTAIKQGEHKAVQAFGRRMVQDHEKMAEDLKQLARKKDVELPQEAGEDHTAAINEVKDKSGDDFDRAYMRFMIRDHQESLADFQRMASSAKDADVRAFASKYASTMEQHLQHARNEAKKVGVNTNQSDKDKKKDKKDKKDS